MMGWSIEFAPLNIPMSRRIETLSAGLWLYTLAFSKPILSALVVYLIVFTRLWWLTLIYVAWIFFDRHSCENGGRRMEWLRNLEWWRYFRNYFPIRLHRMPWIEFDPSKNYLFCCFPHGILPAGAFSVFATEPGEFEDYFPGVKPHLCILDQHFNTPFFRDVMLGLGAVSPSTKSLNHLLGKPGGGNGVALIVGGVAEAYYCNPRKYKLVLKNRKGFIKVALRNGCSLVPVFSFGETDLFRQIDAGDDSFYKRFQERLRRIIGLAPIIPVGRGFFQYSFGMVPHRRPVNVVVGAPIPLEKTDNPTQKQIDDLHEKFTASLTEIFETQKHYYIKDSDDIHLELV